MLNESASLISLRHIWDQVPPPPPYLGVISHSIPPTDWADPPPSSLLDHITSPTHMVCEAAYL